MRRYFFIVFVILSEINLVGRFVHAQTDSVNYKLSTLAPKERVGYLHTLIINNWLNNPAKAMDYANQAIILSDSIGDKALYSKSIRLKGGVHYYLGNYDSTLLYTRQSLDVAIAVNDTVLIDNSLNNLGLVYYGLGSYQNALENLLRSLRLKEYAGEVYGRAQTINNIGLVYNKLKDYERARTYFHEALDFATLHNDPNLQLYSLNNIGGTYLSEENNERAREYFERSLKLHVDNKNWNAVTLSGLAQVALKNGAYEEANDLFDSALKLRKEIDDKNGVSEIYYFFAKDAQIREKYDSAIYFLNGSQQIAKTIGSKDRMFENYELYVELYSQTGNLKKAFDYQTELLKLRDVLFNENMARNLSDIQLKIQEEEARALLSNKDKQLSDSKKVTGFLIIIILLVVIMLIMIWLAFRNNRRINKILAEQKEEITQQKETLLQKNAALEDAHNLIKEQNKQLEEYNEDLQQKVNERTQALEESNERLKIANLELDNFIYKSAHDIKGPLATLMGVCNVALIDVKDPDALQYLHMLSDTSKGLNEILERLKTVSEINMLELTKEKIDFNKIVEKSIEQVKKIEHVKRVNAKLKIQTQIDFETDPFLLDLVMFNMIHNAFKFQKDNSKERIEIRVSQDNEKVIIHFIDNGIGIEEEDTESIFHIYSKSSIKHQSLGLGLYVVKQCIQKLGGEIMLVDDEDLTHFKIELPTNHYF